nr:reverse transcriptase domain-containing protein [Tanacetum cinerariifolium]
MNTKEHERRHGSRRSCSPRPSVFSRIRRGRSRSPRQNSREKEGGVFKRLENRERTARSDGHSQRSHSRYTEALLKSKDSGGENWKSRSKKRNQVGSRMNCLSHGQDRTVGYANLMSYVQFTLTGNARVWFDDLSSKSIDSYDDLKKAFLENYLQQKKYLKDPIELHNIKQQDGESTKDFVRRYKLESKDVKGTPECMRISRFVHGNINPELIKRLHDKILKTMDEIMRVTTSFLREEVAASNHKRSRSHHEDSKRVIRNKVSEKEIFGTNRGRKGSKIKEGIEGPMITEAEIGGHCIHRMYVDGGSASEILYEHCFNRLYPKIKNQLVPDITPLIGFSGEVIWLIGQIQLLVTIGDEEHFTSAWMNFMIVRSPSLYNEIIKRPGVRKLQAVSSTAHGMLKISVEGGIITLKSSMLVLLECTMVSRPEGSILVTKPMVDERIKVALHPKHPKQTVMIGSTLTEEGRNRLRNLL